MGAFKLPIRFIYLALLLLLASTTSFPQGGTNIIQPVRIIPHPDGSQAGLLKGCLESVGNGNLSFADHCYSSTLYNWSRSPGGTISVGPNTVTFDVASGGCPAGVAGSNTNHRVLLSGGVGTTEVVTITGGTCTSLARSGTLQFTAANTHSGSWTISSATAGIQEAEYVIQNMNAGNGTVLIPCGTYTIYTQTTIKSNNTNVIGEGGSCTKLLVWADFGTSLNLFYYNYLHNDNDPPFANYAPTIGGFEVVYSQPNSATRAAWTQYNWMIAGNDSTTPNSRPLSKLNINDIRVTGCWNGIRAYYADGITIDNVLLGCANTGIYLHEVYDVARLTRIQCFPYGYTTTQSKAFFSSGQKCILAERADDLQITNFMSYAFHSIDITANAANSSMLLSDSHLTGGGPGITIAAGTLQVNGVTIQKTQTPICSYDCLYTTPDMRLIQQTGGTLVMNGGHLFRGYAPSTDIPIVDITGGRFSAVGVYYQGEARDETVFRIASTAVASITGVTFQRTTNTTYGNYALVTAADTAHLIFTGNKINGIGSGAGTLVRLTNNPGHVIASNEFGGYNLISTTAQTAASIFLNGLMGGGTNEPNRVLADTSFAANLYPETTGIYNVGTSAKRFANFYGYNFDGFTVSQTGRYVSTQKLDLYDYVTGANAFWDIRAAWNPAANSLLEIRDNAGSPVIQFYRAFSGSAADFANVHVDLLPDLDLSQDLGASTKRWDDGWISKVHTGSLCADSVSACTLATVSSTFGVYGTYLPGFHNTYDIGTSGTRIKKIYTVDLDMSGTFTANLVNSTTGYQIAGSTVLNSSSQWVGSQFDPATAGTSLGQSPSFGNAWGTLSSIGAINGYNGTTLRYQLTNTGRLDLHSTTALEVIVSGATTGGGFVDVSHGFRVQSNQGIAPGSSQTLTVRNAADTGSCTITVRGGIITATTC